MSVKNDEKWQKQKSGGAIINESVSLLASVIKENLTLTTHMGVSYIPNPKVVHNMMKIRSANKGLEQAMPNCHDLEELESYIKDCMRCKLHTGRTHIVFGEGDANADLVFVGEAPGAEEDKQGLPFVGRSGKLLTKMIEAMGHSRDSVYICNVAKCRPPENRDPEPDEIETCEPFLKKQLELIKPKVIVALGRYACQSLLKTKVTMSELRGQWQSYEGIDLMPTFHPAYLLRSPSKKKEAWDDLQQVMDRLKASKVL